jgi:hypothetical protein
MEGDNVHSYRILMCGKRKKLKVINKAVEII